MTTPRRLRRQHRTGWLIKVDEQIDRSTAKRLAATVRRSTGGGRIIVAEPGIEITQLWRTAQ